MTRTTEVQIDAARIGASVTPEQVANAIARGRRERSVAFWTMLQTVFGRPEHRDAPHDISATGDRNCAVLR